MTTFEKVCTIVATVKKNRIAASSIKPESLLREELDLDSIGLMEAVVLAEESFNVSVSPHDVGSLKTVADVVAYIDRKTAK